jgi:hypothetical protein
MGLLLNAKLNKGDIMNPLPKYISGSGLLTIRTRSSYKSFWSKEVND